MSEALPLYELRIKEENDQQWVWDSLRKRYMVLTPEEHVRQCLVEYLVQEKGVPRGLISIERGLTYDRRRKRYDLLVFDRLGQPLIACECKAPFIALDQDAAIQLAVYNREIGAPFLLWTNGKRLLCYQRNPATSDWEQMDETPFFNSVSE